MRLARWLQTGGLESGRTGSLCMQVVVHACMTHGEAQRRLGPGSAAASARPGEKNAHPCVLSFYKLPPASTPSLIPQISPRPGSRCA